MDHSRHTPSPEVPPRAPQMLLWLMAGVFTLALGAALQALSSVAVPVVFAVLIALTVAPLHAQLTSVLPAALRWLAHVIVMLVLLAIILALMGALTFAANRVLDALPAGEGDLQSLLAARSTTKAALSEPIREVWDQISGSLGGWLVEEATALARSLAEATGAFITTLVLVFFLVLLALTERTVWRDKIIALWPKEGQDAWTGALHGIAGRLRQFLLIRTLLGLVQAALYVGWLALFGIDLLFVWGLLAFILTYIPNLGSIIAGSLPALYALATRDLGTAAAVAGGLLVIEQIVGNYIDPRIMGRQILLSPFVILVALLLWSWLWGIAGAFLATPIMLSLVVVFNRIGPLRPIALALSDQRAPEDLDAALGHGDDT